MELAGVSGIELLKKEELDPFKATTYGTGEVMKHLLDQGCRTVLMGIGGSATVDGGAGMLQALGARFFDRSGRELAPGAGGGDLGKIARADFSGLDPRLEKTEIKVACDVTNPLTGPSGAAAVFGPQKGAAPQMIPMLEKGLQAWAELCGGDPGLPGGGAAGGTGFMLRTVLKAEICSGADLVIKNSGLPGALKGATLVITGEGCSDEQTLCGKLCAVTAAYAAAEGVSAVLVSGAVKGDIPALGKVFSGVFSISPGAVSLEEAMANTAENLRLAGANLAALADVFGKGVEK
jgi:glycerate kinase